MNRERLIEARLQGGPHDGERGRWVEEDEPPEHVYVVVRDGHTIWKAKPDRAAEVYRQDEERAGVLIYVYTDESIKPTTPSERELVPAGGVKIGPDPTYGDDAQLLPGEPL